MVIFYAKAETYVLVASFAKHELPMDGISEIVLLTDVQGKTRVFCKEQDRN